MNEEELKEIMLLLEKAGWQPQLCDTPLPAYESVHAGNPTEPGQVPEDMIMMPKAFLSMCPENMVRQDDDGVSWLIPQNKAEQERYKVICLDDPQERVFLCGVVKEILRTLPRIPTKALRATLAAMKPKLDEEPKITEQRVDEVIRIVAKDIKIARMWYAVCRPMIDELVMPDKQYDVFCNRVRRVVPHHEHLPRVDEMQTMAVESFSKQVSKWDEQKAPVKGKRYRAYKELAERTTRLLTMSDKEFRQR